MKLIKNYIPVRIASTGSNREAEIAGNTPEINPIKAESPVPSSALPIPKTNSKSSILVSTWAIMNTKISPTTPPMTDRITDKKKKLQ